MVMIISNKNILNKVKFILCILFNIFIFMDNRD